MSPLWGFDVFVYPVCYKHAAPLGLDTPMSLSCLRMMFHLSHAIVGDWKPSPTGWETQPLRI